MRRGVIATGLLLLLAVPAWGGSVGGMLSYWSTDEADDDTGLGLKLDLDVGQRIDFELRGSQFDNHVFPEAAPTFEIEATPIDIGLGFDFPRSRVTPYVGGGLSYVLLNIDTRPPFNNLPGFKGRIKDEAGWYGVAGVEGAVGRRLEVFFEVLYRSVEAEIQGDDIQTFTNVKVDLSGPAANLGIQLTW